MYFLHGRLRSSPTDLANFLTCRHRTGLDLRAAKGELQRPTWNDPLAVVLRGRGQEHEAGYVAALRAQGLSVADLTRHANEPRVSDEAAIAQTVDAMKRGVDVIVQAAVGSGDEGGLWFGYADILRRVEGQSDLGGWHYEVHDTKLASETKGGTMLQLGIYSHLIALLQGRAPKHFVVVTPREIERYRLEDYAAFFRLIRSRYWTGTTNPAASYPNPTDHCEVCSWWDRCNAQRRKDDHLRFVAGLGAAQQAELESRDIPKLVTLAETPLPLPFTPKRGARETYERLREQARLQHQQRTERRPVHELLPIERGRGFCRLPEPSRGDLFLDLEGDPYVRPAGREYLFGLGRWQPDGAFIYRAWWATSDDQEREAFDALIGEIRTSIQIDPAAHIYHYAPYEPSAIKRLMGRYAIREQDVDWLLRGGRFVDLYAVVRESLRAGVESYSIKKLEPFYGFTRAIELTVAGDERRVVELALESDDVAAITQTVRDAVEGYNRDDVESTAGLRTWLESLRRSAIAGGADIPRFVGEPGEPTEKVTARAARVESLRAALLASLAAAEAHEPMRILSFLLDAHYREDKVGWWEYFRMLDLPDDDLFDENRAVARLEFVQKVCDVVGKNGRPTGSEVHRYVYPPQEMDLGVEDELRSRDGKFGTVEAVDREARTIDIKRTKASLSQPHPRALFEFAHYESGALAESIARMAEHVVLNGIDLEGPYAAGLALLLGRPPRVGDGVLADVPMLSGESGSEFAVRLSTMLQRTVLPIQGPPGAGKTYTGARMIVELVRAGRRVGVTANSHKVIANLLAEVADAASDAGIAIRLARKPKESSEAEEHGIRHVTDVTEGVSALSSGEIHVLGGTAWLWSSPAAAQSIDVLVVDEAGQMSLAHVVAVSQAAASLVLLGDPQQLEQPQKGSHPDGVGVGALQHVLGSHDTIPSGRGLFLPETWRLPPAICDFTSEVFYEGRLEPRQGLDVQRVSGRTAWTGAGLRFVAVDHDGCRNASDEEVNVVAAIVDELIAPGVTWIDEKGERALTAGDILVVAPYNAHVSRLNVRLGPKGVRVGTVDRFQGQEAPVVIYTMATSRPEDAPRGMEFLYSRNRLNVATSRARGLAIVVASPRLFEPECRTPRHMHLANALCRFRELAVPLSFEMPV